MKKCLQTIDVLYPVCAKAHRICFTLMNFITLHLLFSESSMRSIQIAY